MTPFDFGAFEKEAARLLSDLRRSAEQIAAYESEIKSGRVSQASVESRVPPSTGRTGTTEEIKSRGAATEELIARQRALAVAQQESAQSERIMGQAMAQSAANMRQNGALTNEFIEEAKRGGVTVRELGSQMSGTIAKFGGWIIAGSAIYFAFDAIKALKTGVVDATSGVTQMSRVINDLDRQLATKEVGELAGYFNLPVHEVTEAAFQMGKAYHSQADALLATKAALYAIKVGEIDAGTATRYLISIIQGFHLPATAMAGLFDQLLTAQKRYAIDLPSLMSGVGRAAGSFRAAGGDVHTLIALITTLQHVSGQTGNVIGTAIQRSPHFIAMQQNQSILQQFGIDPKADIEEVYRQAIEAAQGKSGSVQRQIGEALFGPQYGARVGVFLLQNKKLFEEVFGATGKRAAKGAAQEQLEITLQKTSEQINHIGVSLERLGIGLAEGHLLDSLGLMLHLLNDVLDITNGIVGAFDNLPPGMQKALAYILQISLVMKGLRRLNVGESIAGGPGATPTGARAGVAGAFGYGSPSTFARQAREGFLIEEKRLQEELLRIRTGRGSAQSRQTLALNRQAQAEQALINAPAGSTAAAAAAKQAEAARAEVNATWQRNYALSLDEESIAARLAVVQSATANTRRKIIGGLNTQATIAEAERLGYPIPAGVTRGGLKPPIVPGKGLGAPTPSQLKELEAMKALEARGLVGSATAAGALTGGAVTVTRETSALGQKLTGLRGGLSSMGAAFNGLVGKLGFISIAAFGVAYGVEVLENEARKVEDAVDQISNIPATGKARLEKLKQLRQQSKAGDTFSDRLTDLFTENFGHVGPVPIPALGFAKGGIGQERQEIAAMAARNIEAERQLQARARREGKPVPFRYIAAIAKDIQRVQNSNKSRKEINAALDKYEEELIHSAASPHHNEELRKARELLRQGQATTADSKDLVQALQALKSTQISERLASAVGLIGGSEGVAYSASQARKAALIYQAQVQKLGNNTDAKSIQELMQARQEYFSAIEQSISGDLQRNLTLARSPAERSQAYAQAFARYRDFARSSDSEVKKQEAAIAALQKRRNMLEQAQDTPAGFHAPYGPGGSKDLSKDLQSLDQRIKAEQGILKHITEQQAQKRRYIKDIIQKLREEEFQAQSALRGAREGALEALTADPIRQTEEKLRFLGREITQAVRVYGRDSQQVFQLITEQRQAQQQLVQNQLGLLQARGNLASAGVIEQLPRERAALYGQGGLLAQLRFEQAHRSAFDPKQIIELQAQVKQAQAQLAYDVAQEARQVADARFDIREARANYRGDTAGAARIALQKAKYDVTHAQSPLEKLSAQQNYIQALGAKRDAVANARLETIQFEANIGKITTQEELSQLEGLLHTYKLSLSARRQLREQIHSLRSQLSQETESFNLNVGDFAMPTAYDIRRAVVGGTGGPSITQTNHFVIQNHSNDPTVIGKAIGHALGGAAESAARSAGVA